MCIRLPLVCISRSLAFGRILFSVFCIFSFLGTVKPKMLPPVRFETRRSIRNFTNSVMWLSLAARSFGQFRSASGFVSSRRVQRIMSTHEPMVMVVPTSLFHCGQKKKERKKKLNKSFDAICSQRHRDIFSPAVSELMIL